jgi:hypothetical protein
MEYEKGTIKNYTHIKFTYAKGNTMTVNKATYKHVFPREIMLAKEVEYLIRNNI